MATEWQGTSYTPPHRHDGVRSVDRLVATISHSKPCPPRNNKTKTLSIEPLLTRDLEAAGTHPEEPFLGVGEDSIGANGQRNEGESYGMEGGGDVPLPGREHDQSYAHARRARVFHGGEGPPVNDRGDDHGGDQLARSEDDLGGEVDVIQCRIGQTRRTQQARRQQRIRRQRCDSVRLPGDVPSFEVGTHSDSVCIDVM
jgi:hypothetical protein